MVTPKPTNKGGRPKGSQNALTKDVKSALMMAFHLLENGDPVKWLLKLADKDPRTFAGLLSRCIPQQLAATLEVSHKLEDQLMAGRQRALEAIDTQVVIEHQSTHELTGDLLLSHKEKTARESILSN